MRKMITKVFLSAVIVLLAAAHAECVEFTFTIPTIPATPKIISVSNGAAVEGTGAVTTVYANIAGEIQKSVCCHGVCTYQCEPNCDFSTCGMADFSGVTDPRIVPNPTCIPNTVDSSNGTSAAACQKDTITNPKLYYYFLDNPATMANIGMTYDTTSKSFKADIPIGAYAAGDLVTYFIIAADNRGNVISQVPSSTDVPCSSSSVAAWTSTLATPAIDNCSVMNSYEQCGKYKAGKPTCGTSTSANDPTGDTCGSTGAIDTGGNTSKLDVTGISAGIGTGFSELNGQKVVCSKISLTANSPDIGDNSTPIGAYVMIFFNPDIPDPNPNDIYMPNATAITYAPGISGVDPNLVKVLWNGECVTNPNTPDILACKLVTGGSNETALKISSGDKSLLFIAKDALPNGKTIIGSSSKEVTAVIASGAIQLDGGTPFWLVDLTSGFAVVQKNQSFTISGIEDIIPAAPLVDAVQTCVNSDGTSYPLGECAKAASPGTNKCRLSIKPSPDASLATEYRVYKATTNDVATAIANGVVTTISSNLTSTTSYDDTISTLDGKNYYYFFSAYMSANGNETLNSGMSTSKCTVEDWVAPDPPSLSACATPDGNYGKCLCDWTADTAKDPSLRKFKIVRGTTELSNSWPAAAGVTAYEYTDSDASLVLGQSYTYYVSSIDAGANESSAVSTTCVPEDLQAPEKVADFSAFNSSGLTTLDADIKWNGVEDEDAAYYNVYKCANASLETSCTTYPHANWIKANSGPITHTSAGTEHTLTILDVPGIGNKDFEGDYCFWVEACDNCVTAGTCEGTEANCSGFDTLTSYRVCILITSVEDPNPPASPTNVAAQALPEGKACKLTWNRVETQENGTPFDNPSNPNNGDLDKYAIMSTKFGDGDPGTNPMVINPTGTANKASSPSYTHEGLTNGDTYQYYVIAYDSNKKFSLPQASITNCTPEDITPPDKPADVAVVLGNDNTTCDLSWSAVADDDVLSYSVHRCDDTIANCTAIGQFPATWGDGLGIPYTDITDLELSDFDVDLTSGSYTYCVTAKDPSDNETDIIGTTNCAMCSTSVVELTTDPPTGVSAVAYASPNYGVKVTYTNSPSYVSNGNDGGHNIYSCTDALCATKTQLNTSGLETTDHSSTSYDKADLGVSAGGVRYFGVEYQNSTGGKSVMVVSSSVTLDAKETGGGTICDTNPETPTCNITIKLIGKFVERALTSCTYDVNTCKTGTVKSVEAPYAGAVIRVVNDSTGAVVKEVSLDTDGKAPDIKLDSATEVSPGTNYKVVYHIPAEVYTGLKGFCSNAADVATEGCDIIVNDAQELDANATVTRSAIPVSKVVGVGAEEFVGNGPEIGNANGDNVINLSDLGALKTVFGQTSDSGNGCYRAWADFNMDGSISLSDLSVLKKYFGQTIEVGTGETVDPSLSKDKQKVYKSATGGNCCTTAPCP